MTDRQLRFVLSWVTSVVAGVFLGAALVVEASAQPTPPPVPPTPPIGECPPCPPCPAATNAPSPAAQQAIDEARAAIEAVKKQ